MVEGSKGWGTLLLLYLMPCTHMLQQLYYIANHLLACLPPCLEEGGGEICLCYFTTIPNLHQHLTRKQEGGGRQGMITSASKCAHGTQHPPLDWLARLLTHFPFLSSTDDSSSSPSPLFASLFSSSIYVCVPLSLTVVTGWLPCICPIILTIL